MTIPQYDADLNVIKCNDSCEEGCTTDGCDKMFAIGPCSTIINAINPTDGSANPTGYVKPGDMIFDVNSWCLTNETNNVTLDLNRTDRQKGYLHDCYETTKRGRARPTVTVDIDYCREDEGHCMLHEASAYGCLVAFMCMEDRSEFQENVPADQQLGLMYGIARVGSTPISNSFDQDDNRVYTLTIHKYFWMFNLCLTANGLKALNYKTPDGSEADKVALTKSEQMLKDSNALDKGRKAA